MGGSIALSFGSLALVCLFAFVVLRWLGRKGVGRPDDRVKVIGRCLLEPRRSVYLIEAVGRCFLVGVGDGPISLLAEIDKSAVPSLGMENEKSKASFSDVLAKVLRRRGQ